MSGESGANLDLEREKMCGDPGFTNNSPIIFVIRASRQKIPRSI